MERVSCPQELLGQAQIRPQQIEKAMHVQSLPPVVCHGALGATAGPKTNFDRPEGCAYLYRDGRFICGDADGVEARMHMCRDGAQHWLRRGGASQAIFGRSFPKRVSAIVLPQRDTLGGLHWRPSDPGATSDAVCVANKAAVFMTRCSELACGRISRQAYLQTIGKR